MAEPAIMSEREYGLARGYKPGQSISGAELAAFRKEYAEYRKQAVTGWQMASRPDAEGNLVRVNPHTGLGMAITNAQGQPMKVDSGNPFDAYMNPGVAGAAVDTNSSAFAGVAPSAQPTTAPAGNPVVPVNVNPAQPVQRGAGSVQQGAQPSAPAQGPAQRVRVTAAEFEKTYGRKVQPGTAYPYKDDKGQTLAIIEVE